MSKEEVIHDGAPAGCFSLVDPLVQAQTQTVGYSVLPESMSNGVNTNSSPHQLHLGGPSLVTVGFVTTHYRLFLNVLSPSSVFVMESSQSWSLNINVHWLSSHFLPPILSFNSLIRGSTNSSGGTLDGKPGLVPDQVPGIQGDPGMQKSLDPWDRPGTRPNPSQGFPGVREMGDAREYPLSVPNYNTPVKDLSYKV